jgi:hypothetical protein
MEVTAERVWAQDCLYQRHTKTIADAISWLDNDLSVNQTAESYFMTKVKSAKCCQRQNWMVVSKHWYNLEIDTNKQVDLNLVFANHGEEEEIYPLTTVEIAEAQQKRFKGLFQANCKNTKRGHMFSAYQRHKSAM